MQSHASRHVVSEFLKDLHPDLSAPFPKAVIEDEIAVAYGRRSIPKLISVLALPGLPEEDRAHALRVFNGLLSTQEHKTCAINEGAAEALTALVNSSPDEEVRRLSCEALASMAQIVPGRLAVVAAAGLAALTKALQTTPEAAAGALRQFSTSVDGVRLLGDVFHEVVPALVTMVAQPKSGRFTCKACENAAATLAGITTIEDGIVAALKSHVPRSMVALGTRGLAGEFRFEPKLMDMLEQVASCLEQICHHPYGKTAVREADGIRVLGELLGLQHRPTVHKSVLALMAVSIEKESKVPTMNSAGINLVKLLKGQDEELAANARSALKNVAEHLEARRAVDMLLDLEEREGTLFRGPEPPTPPDYRYLVTLPYPKNEEELLQRYGRVPAR